MTAETKIRLEPPGVYRPPVDAGAVDSPQTPSSPNALARFEFEMGRGNEGTKVLMVEWNASLADGATTAGAEAKQEEWEVSWPGKQTSFPIMDHDAELHRVYFLLPAHVSIPPVLFISQPDTSRSLSTKPMPAIFARGLGVSSKDSGTRGVLHTIWAKKRLAQLQAEIDLEMQENVESVGLEMVLQERQWIVEHFGLVETFGAYSNSPSAPPQSPRSPIGGRLGDKLKGLKLATSPEQLSVASNLSSSRYRLGPLATDVPGSGRQEATQAQDCAPVGSLNAIVDGAKPVAPQPAAATEDELFALPMSPRSPEMKRSPFSIL